MMKNHWILELVGHFWTKLPWLRIVQDGVYFPEVMGKVAKWRDSNRTRKRKACQDFLGSCIAEAAYSKMSESAGKEFRVIRGDLPYSEKDFETGWDRHRF